MQDRILHSTPETLFKFLDKVARALKEETNINDFVLNRQGTYNGMKIKIFSLSTKKVIEIDADLKLSRINLTIKNPYDTEFNFATLYKDNTLSCANFLKQIKEEEKKVDKLLDDILKELNERDKPLKFIDIKLNQIPDSKWTKLLKKLKNFI